LLRDGYRISSTTNETGRQTGNGGQLHVFLGITTAAANELVEIHFAMHERAGVR
jgi:hypothetical protein